MGELGLRTCSTTSCGTTRDVDVPTGIHAPRSREVPLHATRNPGPESYGPVQKRNSASRFSVIGRRPDPQLRGNLLYLVNGVAERWERPRRIVHSFVALSHRHFDEPDSEGARPRCVVNPFLRTRDVLADA